jgi:hypothetical protein
MARATSRASERRHDAPAHELGQERVSARELGGERHHANGVTRAIEQRAHLLEIHGADAARRQRARRSGIDPRAFEVDAERPRALPALGSEGPGQPCHERRQQRRGPRHAGGQEGRHAFANASTRGLAQLGRNAFRLTEDERTVPVDVEEAGRDVEPAEIDHHGIARADRIDAESCRDASVCQQEGRGLRRGRFRIEEAGVAEEDARHVPASVPELRRPQARRPWHRSTRSRRLLWQRSRKTFRAST